MDTTADTAPTAPLRSEESAFHGPSTCFRTIVTTIAGRAATAMTTRSLTTGPLACGSVAGAPAAEPSREPNRRAQVQWARSRRRPELRMPHREPGLRHTRSVPRRARRSGTGRRAWVEEELGRRRHR